MYLFTAHLLQYVPILLLAASRVPSVTAQTPDPKAQACQTASAIVSICLSAHSELSTATVFSSTASCACYSSRIWAPAVFDNYHASCFAFYSTASPQLVAQASSYFHGPIPSDPCAQAGNLLSATTTATATAFDFPQTTAAAYAPCRYVESVASSCARVSPPAAASGSSSSSTLGAQGGATAPPFPASCLCYNTYSFAGTSSGALTAWKPMWFDNSWVACISYFKTANPAQYTSITASPGFEITPCAKAGDVRNSGGSTSSAAASPTPPLTATKSTSGANARVVVGRLDSNNWMPFLVSVVLSVGMLNFGLI